MLGFTGTTAPLLAAAAMAANAPANAPSLTVSVNSPGQQATTAPRDTARFRVRARVPMTCQARFQGAAAAPVTGTAVQLGTFREFCNSPRGYVVVVNYAPGTLEGAQLSAEGDSIVLDGSGRAILSRVNGPKVRDRALAIVPGANGFDSPSFSVNMVAL